MLASPGRPKVSTRDDLRAERAGDGPGRTYTITCDASDAAGNAAQASGAVLVPHDLSE